MLDRAKRYAVYAIPAIVLALIVIGAMSLRTPVPTERYQQCLYAARELNAKHAECKTDETLWEKSIIDPVTYYTFWLTIFTGALASVGVAQWFLISKQINLSRDEFISTHRPRLKIKRVFLSETHAIMPGQELDGTIEIVNIGGTNATIVGSKYRIYIGKFDYTIVPHYVPPNSLPGGKVEIARGVRLSFELIDRVDNDAAEMGTMIRPHSGPGGWHVYIIGEIRYADGNGRVRYLGFCRELGSDGRFRPVDDPEYEYED